MAQESSRLAKPSELPHSPRPTPIFGSRCSVYPRHLVPLPSLPKPPARLRHRASLFPSLPLGLFVTPVHLGPLQPLALRRQTGTPSSAPSAQISAHPDRLQAFAAPSEPPY